MLLICQVSSVCVCVCVRGGGGGGGGGGLEGSGLLCISMGKGDRKKRTKRDARMNCSSKKLHNFLVFASPFPRSQLGTPLAEFEDGLREECSKTEPSPESDLDVINDCLPYVQSDRTSGFQLVWRSYYFESGRAANFYQKIIDIQREGQCCGFGPPKRCLEYDAEIFPNDNTFSDKYNTATISSTNSAWENYNDQRNLCDYGDDNFMWYPPIPLNGEKGSDAESCDQVRGRGRVKRIHFFIYYAFISLMTLSFLRFLDNAHSSSSSSYPIFAPTPKGNKPS